jgi:hypothetical protein
MADDTLYCFHCGRHHPREEMRQIRSKGGGKRWRCITSIEATKRGIAERDAFGKQVTAINSSRQREMVKTMLNPELKGLK